MGQFISIHPHNPQLRLIRLAADVIRNGGVIIAPTDSSYAFLGPLDNKDVVTRIRQLRGMDDKQFFTLMCADLAGIAQVARVDNQQYRLLKLATPGPWTFILNASADVPRRVSHPSRKTIGIRVPAHPVITALLQELGEPVISITCIPKGHEDALNDPEDIQTLFEKHVDMIIDGGPCINQPTTMIDLTGSTPTLLRLGQVDPSIIGISV